MANNNDKNNKFFCCFCCTFDSTCVRVHMLDNEHKVSDGREKKKKKGDDK